MTAPDQNARNGVIGCASLASVVGFVWLWDFRHFWPFLLAGVLFALWLASRRQWFQRGAGGLYMFTVAAMGLPGLVFLFVRPFIVH